VIDLNTKSKKEDTQAINVLFDRLYGKPAAAHDRVVLEELNLTIVVPATTPASTELMLAETEI